MKENIFNGIGVFRMLRILLGEIKYNKYLFMLWLLLELFSVAVVILNVYNLADDSLLVLASTVNGLSTYFIIYYLWFKRNKEFRERMLVNLPVTFKDVALSRTVFFISPFAILIFLNFVLTLTFGEAWHAFATRIFSASGMYLIVLAGLLLVRDMMNILSGRHYNYRTLLAAAVITIIILTTFVLDHTLITEWRKYHGDAYQFYYLILGGILMSLSYLSCVKRYSFISG